MLFHPAQNQKPQATTISLLLALVAFSISACTSDKVQSLETAQVALTPTPLIQVQIFDADTGQTLSPKPDETVVAPTLDVLIQDGIIITDQHHCLDLRLLISIRDAYIRSHGFDTVEAYIDQMEAGLPKDNKLGNYISPGWVEVGSAQTLVVNIIPVGLVAVPIDGRTFSDGVNAFTGVENDQAICLIAQNIYMPNEVFPVVVALKVGDRWTMTFNEITQRDPARVERDIQFSTPDLSVLLDHLTEQFGVIGEMGVEIQYPRTTLEVDRLWRQNQYHSRVRNYDLAMAFIGDSRGYLATRSFESPEHQIWDPIMDIITHVDPDIEGSIGFIPSYLLMLDHPGSKP